MVRHIRWEFPSQVMICTDTALGKGKYWGQGWSVECHRQTISQPTEGSQFSSKETDPGVYRGWILAQAVGRGVVTLAGALMSPVETAVLLG